MCHDTLLAANTKRGALYVQKQQKIRRPVDTPAKYRGNIVEFPGVYKDIVVLASTTRVLLRLHTLVSAAPLVRLEQGCAR